VDKEMGKNKVNLFVKRNESKLKRKEKCDLLIKNKVKPQPVMFVLKKIKGKNIDENDGMIRIGYEVKK
jgi:hypothetical protein